MLHKVDKNHARTIFKRLQNDVEERKRKEEEALHQKTTAIEGEMRTYFKPKINHNSVAILSKTQTSITFHSASRLGMMNIIREESSHPTSTEKHYNFGKTHHMYRSSDTLLKLNLAQAPPLPEHSQPSPTQFEQMYLTSNSTDNLLLQSE